MVVIAFKSITDAVRARKLLRKGGIRSRLTRLDEIDPDYGCAYSLEIPEELFLTAVSILRQASVRYRLMQ